MTIVLELANISRPSQSGDEQLYTMIKAWLESCRSEHERCFDWAQYGRQSSTGLQRPTRLLYAGGENGLVRIVCTADLPLGVPYATLSYCWGGNVPVQLTSQTMSRLGSGFPCHDLPPTFRDAVQIILALGLSYIWIDALCIIQDFREDWQSEAPKMAYVYSQSYVNLAATASTDSSGGLLRQQPNFSSSYHELETTWTDLGLQLVVLAPLQNWYRYISEARLNSRGWVMQERALAPRTIHFAADKIWWQCREFCGHEIRPQGDTFWRFEDPACLAFTGHWGLLISAYSALSFTKASDKLIAISGIARLYGQIHGLPKSDYLVGLWRSALPGQLSWIVDGPKGLWEHETPSWSWVNVNSTLYFYYHHDDDKFICEVTETEMQPELADVFITTGGGVLYLEGCIHRIQLTYRTLRLNNEREAHCVCIGERHEFFITAGTEEADLAARMHIDCTTICLDKAHVDLSESLDNVWFLPIALCNARGDQVDLPSEHWMMEIVGLLVKPSSSKRGVWKRVGFLMAHQDKARWDESLWTTCSLPEGLFTKSLESGRYSFALE